MEYYCNACHTRFKIKPKRKLFQSLTHNEFRKCIRLKHTFQNIDFFDLDSMFNEYIHCHIKKVDLYLVKYDFKLVYSKKIYSSHQISITV